MKMKFLLLNQILRSKLRMRNRRLRQAHHLIGRGRLIVREPIQYRRTYTQFHALLYLYTYMSYIHIYVTYIYCDIYTYQHNTHTVNWRKLVRASRCVAFATKLRLPLIRLTTFICSALSCRHTAVLLLLSLLISSQYYHCFCSPLLAFIAVVVVASIGSKFIVFRNEF